MSELIIKTIAVKGGRGRTSVVINIENSTKEAIDSLALSSERSFNEIAEILFSYAIPKCKITDDKEITIDRYTVATVTASKPSAKAASAEKSEAKPVQIPIKNGFKGATPKNAARQVSSAKKDIPAKPAAKTVKPAVKTAPVKTADTHSAVPTFKLPPISKFIDPKK